MRAVAVLEHGNELQYTSENFCVEAVGILALQNFLLVTVIENLTEEMGKTRMTVEVGESFSRKTI